MKLLNYYRQFFVLSIAITLISIIALAVFGLKLGIDFKGGSVTELEFNQAVDTGKVREVIQQKGISGAQVQSTEDNGVIIRTEQQDEEKHKELLAALKTDVGEFTEKSYQSIGPIVGEQLTRQAVYQLILVSLGIVLYIAYAFRKVTKPISSWQFGIAAVVALLHDLIVVLGIFALLGHFFNIEIDSMFVTAMLTVLGFSVHDTIIVFDRIRENLRVYAGQSIEFVVNHSISQTLVRSLNTSLTVLFVLLALLLFGGETIRYFVLALFVGIVAGTYSSIFVASPILVLWQNYRLRKRK
ncbi:protein translocase subunit SecF [bacterium]|nr:MAG: protein translocase subunit SecF [bacterium]